MERHMFLISTIICTLLFSYSSVASTHLYSVSTLDQRALMRSSYDGINFEPVNAATISAPKFNGVAEFAKQVNSFQRELGGDFSSDQIGASLDRTHFLRTTPRHLDRTSMAAKNNALTSGDNGTLILITLGFAALGLSRRRFKLAALANSELTCTQENYPVNSEAFDLNTLRIQLYDLDKQAITATGNDAFVENTGDSPEPVQAEEESESDRNPYPKLALSVQKLEALAHEMAHLC